MLHESFLLKTYFKCTFNPLKTETGMFANSEDPDEMPHNAIFHQDLHYVLRQNRSSEKEL